jgi:hypothetical protein
MGAKLQGSIIAVLEESCAVNTQQCFRLLDGHPLTLFRHDLEGSRVRTQPTELAAVVKMVVIGFFYVKQLFMGFQLIPQVVF